MVDIHLNLVWIIAIFLVAIRMGVIFFSTPLYSFAPIPAQVKILFVVSISAVIVLAANPSFEYVQLTVGGIVSGCIAELFVGAVLAFGVQVAFASLQWGGRVVDMQIGFSVANLIDPATRTQAPLMGTILSIFALMVFYAVDGHHMIIKGLAFSLKTVPPGSLLKLEEPSLIINQFGALFTFGLMAVAPVIFSLSMVDIVIAVAAKTMPQMNVFFVGLPIKIFLGMSIFAMTIKYMFPLLERIFSSMFVYWNKALN